MIREEFASSSSFSSSTPEPRRGLRLRTIARSTQPIAETTVATPTVSADPQLCAKHPGQITTTKCFICSKPMCPQCMELFGYFCSPLCKARADSHGIEVPIYEGQRSVKEAQMGRCIAWVTGAAGAVIAALLGFWFWYAWFGSAPRVAFSIRFPQRAYSGQTAVVGDQLIVLHGGTLIREDMKQKKQLWSRNLIDKSYIDGAVAQTMQFAKTAIDRANNDDPDNELKMPSAEKIAAEMERTIQEELQLRMQGSNIWVILPNKLTRYDWETGNPTKEIPVPAEAERLVSRGEELLLLETHMAGEQSVTRVNLTTCDSRTDSLAGESKPRAEVVATNLPFGLSAAARFPLAPSPPRSNVAIAKAASRLVSGPATAGLPMKPGKDSGKPLDPAKVAAQAQHMSLPARIALPATLSANMNQERALAEASDQSKGPSSKQSFVEPDNMTVIPGTNGFTQFSVRLVEQRIVTHSAMKGPPKTSILNGTLTAGNTMEAANEILNEMQRSRGGDVVEEDESRYLVTMRKAGGKDDWSGEVIGPPKIFPLQTVNVVSANKMILVFDKANNPLWKSQLNYNIGEGFGDSDRQEGFYGQGPCIEHKGSLYVFDQGVLTAFDLATGNARWRLPSVGVTGLFFDDKDMMYVNTTTADPESIKYSRQIDITQKAVSVVMKIDPRTGVTLWTAQPGGLINYVSGPFIYTVQSYQPQEDSDDPYHPDTGFEASPYLRIRRLNPKNGHEMWEHYQQRAPLDVQFDKNTIRLLFKSEAQVLKFLSF